MPRLRLTVLDHVSLGRCHLYDSLLSPPIAPPVLSAFVCAFCRALPRVLSSANEVPPSPASCQRLALRRCVSSASHHSAVGTPPSAASRPAQVPDLTAAGPHFAHPILHRMRSYSLVGRLESQGLRGFAIAVKRRSLFARGIVIVARLPSYC